MRPRARRTADSGVLESVVQLLSLCLLSIVSEQQPIKRQQGRSGFSESGKRGVKTRGQRENRRKRCGRRRGRSDELSVA